MKKYNLLCARQFPATHPKAGQPTGFAEAIRMEQKIHTLRLNYFYWEKIVNQMGAGKACIQLRQWELQPYRSPQRLLGVYTDWMIGIEKLFRHEGEWWCIDEKDKLHPIDAAQLAKNDGLSLEDFEAWFKSYKGELIACLHFTPFRYANQ